MADALPSPPFLKHDNATGSSFWRAGWNHNYSYEGENWDE